MWPDWVSNPRPLPLESDALSTALRGPAVCVCMYVRERKRERERERERKREVHIHSCLQRDILL